MSANELRGIATNIYVPWKSDLAHCDFALAMHKWTPSTLESGVQHLRLLGRFAVRYPGLPKDKVLATYLRHLATKGKKSATLRGAISAVHLYETLGFLAPTVPTVQKLHWAMAAGAHSAYHHDPPKRIWATPCLLVCMAQPVRRPRPCLPSKRVYVTLKCYFL